MHRCCVPNELWSCMILMSLFVLFYFLRHMFNSNIIIYWSSLQFVKMFGWLNGGWSVARFVSVCMSISFSLCWIAWLLFYSVLFFHWSIDIWFLSRSINITWNIQQSASNELNVRVLDKCINIYQANKYKILSSIFQSISFFVAV